MGGRLSKKTYFFMIILIKDNLSEGNGKIDT